MYNDFVLKIRPVLCCDLIIVNNAHDTCNKENVRLSPLKNDADLSLYGSPGRKGRATPSFPPRRALEDFDPNSQDSGYGASFPDSSKFIWCDTDKFFRDAQSLGVTPYNNSPPKTMPLSQCSMESMDDDFFDLSEIEPIDENTSEFIETTSSVNIPPENSKMEIQDEVQELSPILENFSRIRPTFRRSVSLDLNHTTPNSSRARSCLFRSEEQELRLFKRPEPPVNENSSQVKRFKLEEKEAAVPEFSKPLFKRSFSATEESIKVALHRSSMEPDLIGDFTKSFCLPLTNGRHQDLKSITPSTLVGLMNGNYLDSLDSYQVIDCRYPYEYEGGHVAGAANMFTKEQICEKLINPKNQALVTDKRGRDILIFHCEFSSERAPTLYRYLRNLDRSLNKDVYPALYYPEIYLLDGGYKNFFEKFPELCAPKAYKPMKHPEHVQDLRHFRSKSKSWNGERTRASRSILFKREMM